MIETFYLTIKKNFHKYCWSVKTWHFLIFDFYFFFPSLSFAFLFISIHFFLGNSLPLMQLFIRIYHTLTLFIFYIYCDWTEEIELNIKFYKKYSLFKTVEKEKIDPRLPASKNWLNERDCRWKEDKHIDLTKKNILLNFFTIFSTIQILVC